MFNTEDFFAGGAPSQTELCGEGVQLDGCLWAPRNICPLSAAFGEVPRVAHKLAQVARPLGTAKARSVDILYVVVVSVGGWGGGLNEEGMTWCRIFALLSAASLAPALQVYTMCKVAERSDVGQEEMVLPVKVEIDLGASSLGQRP